MINTLQDSVNANKPYLPNKLFMMLTQTKIKKENKQIHVLDATKGTMLISRRGLIGLFAVDVVDFGYFPCILGQLEDS